MTDAPIRVSNLWTRVGLRFLPFADAASEQLPLGRLLRLSLFQISVGMAVVLLSGTLNRVMILEMSVPAWLVALMISLPLVTAPFRALIGHRSDHHHSVLGWKRVPYIWLGTLLQFGGFAIMPFALLVLGEGPTQNVLAGTLGAGLAFLLAGAGLHTAQTAGLALANDLAPEEDRPRVVALLYVMLLVGMVASALIFGLLLDSFSPKRLIQVIQGAAALTMILNVIALWKQEPRIPLRGEAPQRPSLFEAWAEFRGKSNPTRLLLAIGLGSAAFSMQDVLLEPYGGEVLGMTVGETTALTAFLAGGALLGFMLAARRLSAGAEPHRLAAIGLLAGIWAFSAVIFAGTVESALLFRIGSFLIGFGGGLFAVGTLTAVMALASEGFSGLALGAWGAVQATATGLGFLLGGALRDLIAGLAVKGHLGEALKNSVAGYAAVYHIEIILLFLTLIAIGPLARHQERDNDGRALDRRQRGFGLADMPN
jgi:BCD family chlorophyll transporter-like MFS transporter